MLHWLPINFTITPEKNIFSVEYFVRDFVIDPQFRVILSFDYQNVTPFMHLFKICFESP